MKKIALLKTKEDGSVDALSATNATLTILDVLSVLYKVNVVDFAADVLQEGGIYYLRYLPIGGEAQLIATDWIEILEQKLYAITQAIHESPHKPDLAVLGEVGMTVAGYNIIINKIIDNRPLFNSLGFCQQRGERKIQLKLIVDPIAKKSKVKEFTSCIAAVCTFAAQPYVTFFYYNGKGLLQRYNDTFSRIEANLTLEDALKLDDIRIAEKGQTKQTILNIRIMEIEGAGRKYKLLSYDFLCQNMDLDLE
jgi:hypothetical protein